MKRSRILSILVLLSMVLMVLPVPMTAQSPAPDRIPLTEAPVQEANAPAPSEAPVPEALPGEWKYGPTFPFWTGNGIARISSYYWPETERVYILGGRLEDDSTSGMVIEFDPATETFADTGAAMQTPVSNYFLDRLNIDGADQICLVMGRLGNGTMATNVQCYNPATNATTEYLGDPFPGAPRLVGGQAAINNLLYVFGGFDAINMFDDTWVFDPSQPVGSRWTDLGVTLSSPRSYIATAVIGDLIYAIGGDEWVGGSLVPVAVTEVLDTTDIPSGWQDGLMADLPAGSEAGDWPGIYVDGPYVMSGYIYTTGGYWPQPGPYDYFFQYDPVADTWDVNLPALQTTRRNHAMSFVPSLGGNPPRLWVFGGYDGSATNAMTDSTEYFEVPPVNLVPSEQTTIGAPCAWVSSTLTLANNLGYSEEFDITYTGYVWDTQGPASVGPIADGDFLDFTVAVSVPCDAGCYDQDTVQVDAQAQSNPVYSDTATITTQLAGVTVEGHVLDANYPADGIYGAYIYIEKSDDENVYFESYSDLDGYYALAGVPPGTFVIDDVSAIGYSPILSGTIDVTGDEEGCVLPQDFYLGASMVEVDPASLSATTFVGDQVQATITLSNPGTADLLFHVEEIGAGSPYPVPDAALAPPAPQRVDPQVYEEMAASPDGTTKFLIVMKEQADLSAAYAISDWEARGQYVYNTLKATAERSQAGLRNDLAAQGVTYSPVLVSNGLWVEADSQVLDSVLARNDVAYVMANRLMETLPMESEPVSPDTFDWNIELARANEVWDAGYDGTGVVVANIDTGVWYTHDALRRQYRGYDGGSYDHDYNWYHPTSPVGCDGSTQPCDNDGHGTSTMGIMAGETEDLSEQIGMAPGAQWIACKGCEFNSCSSEALLGCADWMLAPTRLDGTDPDPAMRPHVINNSWGGSSEDGWYFPAVAAWRASGMFPAFANGNSGPACGTAHSPGDYYNAFSSGAIYYAGPDNYQIAGYSSRGPTLNYNLLKPNIAAPADPVHTSTTGGDSAYTNSFNGTSSASPHTAGEVALIWSAQPELIGQIEMTEWLIEQTAAPVFDDQCDADGSAPNNVWGWGIIDAYEAVTQAIQADWGISWLDVDPMGGSVAPGETGDLAVTFDATDLEAGMCYSATLKIETNSPYASEWPTMSLDVFLPVELCVEEPVPPMFYVYLPIVAKNH